MTSRALLKAVVSRVTVPVMALLHLAGSPGAARPRSRSPVVVQLPAPVRVAGQPSAAPPPRGRADRRSRCPASRHRVTPDPDAGPGRGRPRPTVTAPGG